MQHKSPIIAKTVLFHSIVCGICQKPLQTGYLENGHPFLYCPDTSGANNIKWKGAPPVSSHFQVILYESNKQYYELYRYYYQGDYIIQCYVDEKVSRRRYYLLKSTNGEVKLLSEVPGIFTYTSTSIDQLLNQMLLS